MARGDERPGVRPRQSWGRQLDIAARHAFPLSSTMVLMLLCQAPFGIADQATLLPAVTLACVWFWSVYRPAAMPPPAVFLVGLLFDLLGYLPLGVGALTALSVHGVAMRLRRRLARQGFVVIWLTFITVAGSATAISWALISVLATQLMPTGPALFQVVLCAALYPALAIPLAHAHRTVADPERA